MKTKADFQNKHVMETEGEVPPAASSIPLSKWPCRTPCPQGPTSQDAELRYTAEGSGPPEGQAFQRAQGTASPSHAETYHHHRRHHSNSFMF